MSLTREQILAAADRTPEKLSVPEWGGDVCVTVMSGEERDAYEVAAIKDRDKSLENMRAKLAVLCATDETGNKLFRTDDIDALGKKSWLALQRVGDVAQRLNKLTNKDMEEIKGNSEPSRGAEPSSV